MSAKPYCSKTAAVIGWVIQNFPAEVDDGWIGNADATKELLAPMSKPPVKKKEKIEKSFFFIAASMQLDAVPAKLQSECFVGDRWSYRDRDFDNWFPKDQSAAGPCTVTTIYFKRTWKFMEFAIAVLGDEWKGKSVKKLGNEIIRRKITLTNAQAEAMVEKTEAGEKSSMRIDGYGNFYFTETGDEENPVAVANVRRVGRSWSANVYALGIDDDWDADGRFLLRNLETPSTL
jgi:hypothetical protein